jgi:hypothetical protein
MQQRYTGQAATGPRGRAPINRAERRTNHPAQSFLAICALRVDGDSGG